MIEILSIATTFSPTLGNRNSETMFLSTNEMKGLGRTKSQSTDQLISLFKLRLVSLKYLICSGEGFFQVLCCFPAILNFKLTQRAPYSALLVPGTNFYRLVSQKRVTNRRLLISFFESRYLLVLRLGWVFFYN